MTNSEFNDSFTAPNHPLYGWVRLPQVDIDASEKMKCGLSEQATNADFLKAISQHGLDLKGLSKEKRYVDRMERELETVEKLGFTDYFLLIWRLCARADKKGIARDYGRGSCAGSLVFFLIGTTLVDPLRYGLFFERFISETRAKKKVINGVTYIDGSLAPDVDCDIEQARRGEVIDDLAEMYPNRVCKISTVSTLSGKILIKECGKIVGLHSEEEMKDIADLIPKEFGIICDIEEAYEGKKDLATGEWSREPVVGFRKWCDRNPTAYQTALQLRDLIKNRGTHPSGFVVSYDEVKEFLPLEYEEPQEGTSSGQLEIASSLSMDDISNLAVKVDILGVRCCSVVADVLKATGEKIEDINVDSDELIYDNLQNLQTPHGVFQIEAPTNLKVAQIVKPRNLEELSDVLAIARPGALSFLSKYAENKVELIHPLFDPILASTRGVCLFQEQMMGLSHAIGFTLDEAEQLRRIVAKKKPEQVAQWQQKIKDKIIENQLPIELGDLLWKILEASASYSFNKCIFEEEKVELQDGRKVELREVKRGDMVLAFDVTGNKDHYVKVINVFHNRKDCFESDFEGYKITTSSDHQFLCADRNMWRLKSFWKGLKTFKVFIKSKKDYLKQHLSSRQVGVKNTIDLEVDHPDHNFYCNDIVVSNSHSNAYASLSALTLYLKFKHPLQFFLALLRQAKNEPAPIEEIQKIETELKWFGIRLLPPDLIKSEMDFVIEGQDIRFGLSSIKGISDKTLSKLMSFKTAHTNRFELFESASVAGLSVSVLCALIHCGCLDSVARDARRPAIALQAQLWNILTDKEKRHSMSFGERFGYNLFDTFVHLKDNVDIDGKPFIKPSRLQTILKKYEPKKAIWKQNSQHTALTNVFYERKLLGYSYSHQLKAIFDTQHEYIMSLKEVMDASDDDRVAFVAFIQAAPIERTSAKKNKYAKFIFSDESGCVEGMIFNSERSAKLDEIKSLHGGELPSKDAIVYCSGRKKGTAIFLDTVRDKKITIYTKFGDFGNNTGESEL